MRSESNRNPLLGDEAARYAVYDGIRRDVEAVRGRGNRGHALARSPFRASRRNGDTKPGGITQTRSCDREGGSRSVSELCSVAYHVGGITLAVSTIEYPYIFTNFPFRVSVFFFFQHSLPFPASAKHFV